MSRIEVIRCLIWTSAVTLILCGAFFIDWRVGMIVLGIGLYRFSWVIS